jgi:hypothetical protein
MNAETGKIKLTAQLLLTLLTKGQKGIRKERLVFYLAMYILVRQAVEQLDTSRTTAARLPTKVEFCSPLQADTNKKASQSNTPTV